MATEKKEPDNNMFNFGPVGWASITTLAFFWVVFNVFTPLHAWLTGK